MLRTGYRPCVGVMLLNREGKVFIGQRAPSGEAEAVDARFSWQMPQGGIDKGESPLEAARRELFEETNVQSASLLMEAPEWLYYDLPGDVKKRAWRGRFKGQAQKWFAFRFEGHDDEIDVLHPAGELKAEFAAWRWESMERLPDLIIPFKRDVYEKVILAFRSLAG